MSTYRLNKESTILWFELDLCGLRHRRDAMDTTLDNNTGSKRIFQRQEQVKDNITGWYHATDHIVSITRCRWYLPDKKKERVQIQNLLQELSHKQIYVKYTLPVRQSPQSNIMNYLFNKLFYNLKKRRVNISIIMFLVWMSLQKRMIRKKHTVNWLFYFTLKKISIHRLLLWCSW